VRVGKRERGSARLSFDYAGEEFIVFSEPVAPRPCDGLTPSEKEILTDVARGRSNAAIARARGTSVRTVANQIAGLFRKIGASSRAELARIVSRAGSSPSQGR